MEVKRRSMDQHVAICRARSASAKVKDCIIANCVREESRRRVAGVVSWDGVVPVAARRRHGGWRRSDQMAMQAHQQSKEPALIAFTSSEIKWWLLSFCEDIVFMALQNRYLSDSSSYSMAWPRYDFR